MQRIDSFVRPFFRLMFTMVFFLGLVTGIGMAQDEQEEAQQEEAQQEVQREPLLLEQVTVTGARVEKDLFSTPMGMNVVDQRKLLEEQPRAAAEALRDEPGLWIQKTGHIGGAPIIRGLMGKQILLLMDGVRYNDLNSFTGPNSWTNMIDVAQIERIEVIRGPGSVLYGTDALGGVINIITKRNREFSDTFQIRSRLSARYGSVDRSSIGRLELWGSSPHLNFLLGSTLKRVNDLRGGRGIGLQVPSGWKEGNYDLRSTLKLAEGHYLDLAYQDFRRYDETRFDRPSRLSEGNRELLSAAYDGRTDSPLLSDFKVKAAFHNREDFREDTGKLDNRFSDTETLQTEAQATTLLGETQRLIYGIHYHRDSTEGWRETKKGHSTSPNAWWDNFGVFLQDEVTLLDERLWLIPALRWDWYSIERGKDQSNPKDIGVSQQNTALTGNMGLVFGVTDTLNFTATVGRGFRAPNNSDYRSAPSLFTYGVSAPTTEILDPETSTNYEVGLRLKHDRVQGSLSLYTMLTQNLIGNERGTYQGKDWYDWDGNGERDPDEDVFVKANAGEEIIYGIEAQALVRLNDAWSVAGNFTYIDGKNRTEDAPLARAFPTNGTLRIRWQEPQSGRMWAELASRLVADFDSSRVPESRLERDPAFRVNPQDRKSPFLSSDGTVPGYAVLNLRGGFNVNDWMTLTFGVENLTDRKYRVKDSRIDAPGLNFVVAWTVRP